MVNTMESRVNRKEWVESEFKKWKERYEIPFEKEFNVKALLELKYQYYNTDDNHVKTKADLIHTIVKLQNDLNLKMKRKASENPVKLLFVANNSQQARSLFEFLINVIDRENIVKVFYNDRRITTKDYDIRIATKDHPANRGIRCHDYFNLTGDKEFEEQYLKNTLIR